MKLFCFDRSNRNPNSNAKQPSIVLFGIIMISTMGILNYISTGDPRPAYMVPNEYRTIEINWPPIVTPASNNAEHGLIEHIDHEQEKVTQEIIDVMPQGNSH